MTKLTDEAKKAIGEIRPSLVATSGSTGKPNVSAKGSLRVLDDEHVVFADIASPRTVANIRENPQVAVICLDAAFTGATLSRAGFFPLPGVSRTFIPTPFPL